MTDECAYMDLHRAILDEDRPGWTQETVWCPPHRREHVFTRKAGQVAMAIEGGHTDMQSYGHGGKRGTLLPDGKTICFHGNTSAAVYGQCAYCGAQLHVHQDALGAVKSGRAGRGYLEEKCPACHRANAVIPAYGLGGIRTARLENGAPVMEMKLTGR